jgi:hypothetical protein
MEYWEKSFWFTTAGTFLFFYLTWNVVPNTNIKDWAHEEAAVRLARREAGLPVEYGTLYATKALLEGGAAEEEVQE